MFRWWCRWCNVSLGGGLGGGSGGCQLVAAVMDPNITTISPVNKLHPRDDVLASGSSSGGCQLVAAVMDPNSTTISPMNKLHPHDDVLASGSSRSIFIWMPKEKFESELQGDENRIILCGKGEKKRRQSDDESDDSIYRSKGKSLKTKKSSLKSSSHGREKMLIYIGNQNLSELHL
ncbi:unnamed protein product [Fraxinus pennsylvanica]|uniref:Uncharacterized protein n=1 Tax=Fraxinus pennsylvanica TaxID=56036 RepID=A0AAD1ZYY4_9LAMI|nr:unnamed protein product [Fraxinus pennsylvanica]